jgi:hypothetical protein
MFETIRWWFSFRRNVNFWDWMKDTYSLHDLKRLANEATDCNLQEGWNPLGNQSIDQFIASYDLGRKTTKRLYRRYGGDIWHICLGAYDNAKDGNLIHALSRLELADQVDGPYLFEELLLRNAMKRAANQILDEINNNKPTHP